MNKKDILKKRKAEILEQTRKSIEDNRPEIIRTDAISFLNSYEDNSIDILITDPPYSTDIKDIESFANEWLPLALQKLKPNGRAFISIGAYPKEQFAYIKILLNQDKFNLDNPLIWTYRNTLGRVPKMKYNLNYQVILHLYSCDSPSLDTSITGEMFSVQDINAPDGRQADRYHRWQKPEELALRLIRHASENMDDNLVLVDCFACTGTFLIAGAKLGFNTRGCDISQENIDIALNRGCIQTGGVA